MKKILLLAFTLPLLVAALADFPYGKTAKPFHNPTELKVLRSHFSKAQAAAGELPIDSSVIFLTAKTCGGCHGFDPTGFASVNNSGEDVNVYDDWGSTMMANAAKDPFWRAKVSHEILINPSHSLALQDKCTSCHAPTGHYQAKLKRQQPHYLLADLLTDTLGLDGVTCQACHAQAPALIGSLHSGALNFDTNKVRVAYGPYEMPFAPPMRDFVGITPLYGEHISDAGLCAGCHTLITGTVDLAGNLTGGTFVEQATYHEWLNSRYDRDRDNVTCQACHLPQIPDEVIVSSNYQFLTPKFPYGLHEMAGANVTMLQLLKENRARLGIGAKTEHFDSTITATLRMLQQKTLDLTLEPQVLNGDTAFFALKLANKAGHKFPSGYPSRRAWVEFEVKNAAGQTVFHSGRHNPDYSLPDEDANVEPHHLVINRPDQVQIYEMVPGDVSGAFTNVLERGDKALKDNRLTPQGFSTAHSAYDTTLIIGSALIDPDFNRFPDGTEGSGADILRFHIPINGYSGALSVTAKVWYQSLPPKWMAPLFAYSSPEIDSFRQMFDAADRSPVLVASVEKNVNVTPVSATSPVLPKITVSPTLSADGRIHVDLPTGMAAKRIRAWDASGQMVWDKVAPDLVLPQKNGVYFIEIQTSKERVVRRVVRGG
ncbi:MAG: hypothetical protein ABMA02_00880 [Saprospiraceae bacterium]